MRIIVWWIFAYTGMYMVHVWRSSVIDRTDWPRGLDIMVMIKE